MEIGDFAVYVAGLDKKLPKLKNVGLHAHEVNLQGINFSCSLFQGEKFNSVYLGEVLYKQDTKHCKEDKEG